MFDHFIFQIKVHMTQTNIPDRNEAIARLTAEGEDYELIPGKVWDRDCRIFKNAPPTLRDLFEASRSDETFLVYEEERYSFEETHQRVCQIAALLVNDYGIQKGDRVAISMRNYPEWVMTFNAITSIGAIAVAMNALWLTDEMAYGLTNSGSKVLFADQERMDRLEPVYADIDLRVIAIRPQKQLPEGISDLNELLKNSEVTELPQVDLQPNDPATIFYTSGSTDHPKGVLSCHRNVISSLLSWELDIQARLLELGVTPEPPVHQPATLLAVPLFHATGSHAVMLSCYRGQRKMVSMFKWDVEKAAELIEVEHIAGFTAPAAMTGDLVETARKTNRDLSSLMSVGGGGAPRAPDQVKNIASTFDNALPGTGWGMTETNAIGTGIGGEDYLEHPSSSGRVSAVLDIRIMDETGNELPAGERGELQIRGASVFQGYWQRPEANAETFVGDWMRTGDVAYVDAEGYLYIVDRIKDLVIRGGENIGCAEVEHALLEHEHILEASVYAVPDERLGEEVGTTLYCSANLTEDDILNFLSDRVARFKLPKYITFSPEPLPRIASGKINKRQIREDARNKLSIPA
jgi:long-chain acyl-CoA synthetase